MMSDTSEEEDLSKFREAVDFSFANLVQNNLNSLQSNKTSAKQDQKAKSERYLETVSHYNDVKVPEKLQQQIGAKISAIIRRNIEFIDVKHNFKTKKPTLKGGVKLFKNSEKSLNYEEKDIYTDINCYDIKNIKKDTVNHSKVTHDDVHKPEDSLEINESNDIIIPEVIQDRVSEKLSDVISRNIEFVDMKLGPKVKKSKVKQIKLFKNSSDFLTCDENKDTYTEVHNKLSKKIKKKRRIIDSMENELNDYDKVMAATVNGGYILSKQETKLWKSRRKEKLYKYKKVGGKKVLIAVET